MAAARRLVHSLHYPIRRDRVFPDRTNPLDIHDDIELFQRFRFPCRELLEVLDNFTDDVTFSSSLFSPSIVHCAGNVASGVQGIGGACPHVGFLLSDLYSTRVF